MSSLQKKKHLSRKPSRKARSLDVVDDAATVAPVEPLVVVDCAKEIAESPASSGSANRRLLFRLLLVPLFGGYIASFSMWSDKAGNVVTGLGLGGWGDLLFHIRAAVFFAEQGWPRESFFLAGQPVGYAFLSDFISGLLWRIGFSTADSFSIPTVFLVVLFLMAL